MKKNTLGNYNPFAKKTISYLRARLAFIEGKIKGHKDKDGMDYHLLKHGIIPYEREDSELIHTLEQEVGPDNGKPSFMELTRFGNWFVLHPEKICGVEVISRQRLTPIVVRGSKSHVINTIKEKILHDRKLFRNQSKPTNPDTDLKGTSIAESFSAHNLSESETLRFAKAKAEAILRLSSYE